MSITNCQTPSSILKTFLKMFSPKSTTKPNTESTTENAVVASDISKFFELRYNGVCLPNINIHLQKYFLDLFLRICGSKKVCDQQLSLTISATQPQIFGKFEYAKKPGAYYRRTRLWLQQEYPDFQRFDLSWKTSLICGKPQSGKSDFIFAIALMKILSGDPAILVCRNFIQDAKHMTEKMKRFTAKHVAYMKNYVRGNCPSLEAIYAGDDAKPFDAIQKSLVSRKKKLVVVLANGTQLKSVNKLLTANDIRPIVFIDEADAIGYAEEKDPAPALHKAIEYNNLISMSSQTVEISATVWDILAGNPNLTNINIVSIRPNINYKSCLSVQYKALQYKIKSSKEGVGLYDEDRNLHKVLLEMSITPVYSKSQYNCESDHPVVCLMKTKYTKAHHREILHEFETNTSLNKIWSVITECDEGTTFFSDNLRGKTITINGNTISDTFNSGEFIFKNKMLIMPQLLQWLYDNGGSEKFSHIMIKSGAFSGRSRSYVSTNGVWHLTHEYYKGASNVASLLQDQRLLHDRPDSIPLTQYAHESVIKDIKKGDMMHSEQIERLTEYPDQVLTSERIRDEVWKIGKVPKVKLCVGTVNKAFKPTKTSADDGGWDIVDYEAEQIRTIRFEDDVEIDRGDSIRMFKDDQVTSNAPKLRKIMDEVINEVMNFGTGEWHSRSIIIHSIVDNDDNGITQDEKTIQGHLRIVYQTKSKLTGVTETDRGCLLLRKVDGNVYLRIN